MSDANKDVMVVVSSVFTLAFFAWAILNASAVGGLTNTLAGAPGTLLQGLLPKSS